MASSPSVNISELSAILEGILFLSEEALPLQRLAKRLGVSERDVRQGLQALSHHLEGRGLVLLWKGEDAVAMVTRPKLAPLLASFFRKENEGRVSGAALEVLSMIAYLGPLSRADIEALRGVNSASLLRNLTLRGLVERQEAEERGYLYAPSQKLLEILGITSLEDLPGYHDLRQNTKIQQYLSQTDDNENAPS